MTTKAWKQWFAFPLSRFSPAAYAYGQAAGAPVSAPKTDEHCGASNEPLPQLTYYSHRHHWMT